MTGDNLQLSFNIRPHHHDGFEFCFKGIRIIKNVLTDALKAKGLGYRQDYVDIYSNSWGPDDSGSEVADAGVMTKEVLKQGALKVCCFSS